MSEPHVLVYGSEGGWRWTYRDADADVVLHGNQDFGTAAAARAAASLAYPGVPVDMNDEPGGEAEPAGRGKLLLKLIGAVLTAVGLIVLLRWIASLDIEG